MLVNHVEGLEKMDPAAVNAVKESFQRAKRFMAQLYQAAARFKEERDTSLQVTTAMSADLGLNPRSVRDISNLRATMILVNQQCRYVWPAEEIDGFARCDPRFPPHPTHPPTHPPHTHTHAPYTPLSEWVSERVSE